MRTPGGAKNIIQALLMSIAYCDPGLRSGSQYSAPADAGNEVGRAKKFSGSDRIR